MIDLTNIFDDPLFACLLIDESASMEPLKQAIIEAQKEVIERLRRSNKCKKGSLYISQYLFNDTLKVLNEAEELNPNGEDRTILFEKENTYNPQNHSTFYDSLGVLLKELIPKQRDACLEQKVNCKFIIVAFTDGDDTISSTSSSACRKHLKELELKGIIQNTMLVILTNSDFTARHQFEQLKEDLGFNTLLLFNGNIRDFRRGLD